MGKKPPLSVRVWGIGPGGDLVRRVTKFDPKELRRQGMEDARTKAETLKRWRLGVVYNAVEHLIGKVSDAECARRCLHNVNANLSAKGFAQYETSKALAKAIARIRKRLSVP